MTNPTPSASAALARAQRSTRVLLAVSVVSLPVTLVAFLAFPSVLTALTVPVAVYVLWAAVRARRSVKLSSAVLALAAEHKAAHAAARASGR